MPARRLEEGGAPLRKASTWLLALALLFCVGCDRHSWWYPFPLALSPAIYSAGPLPITSNIREDDPALWRAMPGLNTALGRLAYAMTRGESDARIAWLHARGEWPDAAALPLFGIDPNRTESALSRALSRAGYVYDRISRRNLAHATLDRRQLHVGHARYDALLIDDWRAAEPDTLANLARFAGAGLPIVFVGDLPQRAVGWSDHASRDERVKALVSHMRHAIRRIARADSVAAALREGGVLPALETLDGSPLLLRIDRRRLADGHLILLFNEHASAVSQRLRLRLPSRSTLLLDPESGRVEPLAGAQKGSRISVPAHRIRLLRLREGGSDASTNSSAPAGVENASGRDEQRPMHASEARWDDRMWRVPPRRFRPFLRWWWPGNAVRDDELLRELRSIAAQGFGGVELQTLTLGFPFEELERDRRGIYGVGSASYLRHVALVMREARRLGLQVDLTLGSGWPSGGPFVLEHPEQQLLAGTLDFEGPKVLDAPLPRPGEPAYVWLTNHILARTIGPFDEDLRLRGVVAAALDSSTTPPTLSSSRDLSTRVSDGRLQWTVPPGPWRLFAFYQNATRHNVAGAAYPHTLAGAPALDHLDPGGVAEAIGELAEPWLSALAPETPAAFFVDSFELIGQLPWSDQLRDRFRAMHGYDILPILPLVFREGGESKYTAMLERPAPAYRSSDRRGERVREDYLATREQLFLDSFVAPLHAWTRSRGIDLRLQAHGGYGDVLDVYQSAEIPESEGLYAGGSFDFLKLASSAAHVAGRRIASSETYVGLALTNNRLDAEEAYLLAGNAIAAGISRIVSHGYAYHLPRAKREPATAREAN